MKKKAKLEMETLGKILLLTAFMIIFLVMFKGCKDSFQDVGKVGMKDYFCWGTNLLNAEAFRFFPTTCNPEIMEEEQTKNQISDLIRRCWWLYGRGELDIGEVTTKDEVFTCYAFKPKEDITLLGLRDYMKEYKISGTKAKKSEDSTWYYVQKSTEEEYAICFDEEKFEDSPKLLAGRTYYINFYDEKQVGQGRIDRLMISSSSKFGDTLTGLTGLISEFFDHCYSFEGKAEKGCKDYIPSECPEETCKVVNKPHTEPDSTVTTYSPECVPKSESINSCAEHYTEQSCMTDRKLDCGWKDKCIISKDYCKGFSSAKCPEDKCHLCDKPLFDEEGTVLKACKSKSEICKD